jgi:hypothetical protein
MFNSQKHAFWQALLVTLLIFGVGIIFGIILENWRTGKIDELYQRSEIDLLDIKLQTEIYSMGNFNCDRAVEENFLFAERIYSEAKLMERYESASTISESLKYRHKKYDILRANLFINSLKIREYCNVSYHDVVYIYKYNNQSMDTKAKQNVFSKVLKELKDSEGQKMLLIPLAGDNGVVSVNLILDKFNIANEELPVILIDGKYIVRDLETADELKKYFQNYVDYNSEIIRLV